jgi:hypothetical protein
MCQRCAGLYIGGAYAALMVVIFRPKPVGWLLWVHGVAMLLMIPFGYHLLAQEGVVRTVTGQLFGFGLVYYLLLNPVDKWSSWSDAEGWRMMAYLLFALLGVPLLLLAILTGSTFVATILAWTGFTGLLVLAALVSANMFVFLSYGSQWWHERRRA